MIDWQLQFTFDNFFRFSIQRISYSTLFMSTTVCSSACRKYEPLIVAVTLSHILLFLVIICTRLHTVAAFYIYQYVFSHHCCLLCLLHISSLGFAVVYFSYACVIYSGFFRGFVVVFLSLSTVAFNKFCCKFSIFQQFQYYLLYICITPTWYISTSGSYITCTYTDNSYCSLIYCSNFLMA